MFPGVFIFSANVCRLLLTRFSSPTATISFTLLPTTAGIVMPIVPAFGCPISTAACLCSKLMAFAPFMITSPSFRVSAMSFIVFPFCHLPLVIITSPGNLLSSISRPSVESCRLGGSVSPLKKWFREKPVMSKFFKSSSAIYPFVVPAMIANVLFFAAFITVGLTAKALPISRLPACEVIMNCFMVFPWEFNVY